MAEWSIAAVLKTVDLRGSGGSNPSLSAKKDYLTELGGLCCFFTFLHHLFSKSGVQVEKIHSFLSGKVTSIRLRGEGCEVGVLLFDEGFELAYLYYQHNGGSETG